MPKPLAAGLVLLLCCSSIACSRYERPGIEVEGFRVSDRSERAVVVTFRLLASNANDLELPMHDIRYEMTIDGWEVFEGRRSAESSVPRGGSSIVELPVPIDLSEHPAAGSTADVRFRGEIDYRLPGRVREALWRFGIRPSVGFDARGEVDLLDDGAFAELSDDPQG